jgi:hypothetical protein
MEIGDNNCMNVYEDRQKPLTKIKRNGILSIKKE